jgi:hypothetical protein
MLTDDPEKADTGDAYKTTLRGESHYPALPDKVWTGSTLIGEQHGRPE